MNRVFLAMVIASALPMLACGDDELPTSPTQPGATVSDANPPAPAPPPSPAPTPAPSEGASITIRGVINMMNRSGVDGIDIVFRIGDEPFIRGDANTVVIDGSVTGNTTYLRAGQTVTVDARQRGDDVYARQVIIDVR